MDEKLNALIKAEENLTQLVINLGETLCQFSEETLRKFNKTKKYFITLRSIVIEFHLLIEYFIEQYIIKYFIDEQFEVLPEPKVFIFQDSIIKNKWFTFENKTQVLKKIFNPKKKGFFKKIRDINDIRNAFAHGYHLEDKKFNYGDKGNIFYKNNAVTLIEDAFFVVGELSKGLDGLKYNKAIQEALKRKFHSSLSSLALANLVKPDRNLSEK